MPSRLIVLLFISLSAGFALNSCHSGKVDSDSAPVAGTDPSMAIEWWDLIYEKVAYERIKPPVASRIYAYLGISVYESLQHGMPGHRSLSGQITGLGDLPEPDPELEYDWQACMVACLYPVVDELLARQVYAGEMAMVDLYESQIKQLSELVPEETLKRSVSYGQELSTELLKWIKLDNYDDTRFYTPYELPTRVGHPERWEPTDWNQEPCEPYWSSLRHLVLESGTDCHIPPALEFSLEEASAFRIQVDEILRIDHHISEEEREIALFYADDPGETATPPGHWTHIMNYVIKQQGYDLEQAAETYALVGIGIAEAFAASWYSKYEVNLVRPKTYIQEFMELPDWEPYVETPPFPEYTSAHACVSATAAELLTALYGEIAYTDSTHVRIGLDPRPVQNFWQSATESGLSRHYGGIHYLFSIEAGWEQGRCVASKVQDRIKLRIDNESTAGR